MATPAIVQDEQHQRLEVKLRRELGDQILRLLDDSLTEDILLNPDGSLWVKQMGKGFSRIGEMPAAQAASALGTIAAWRGTVLNHERPMSIFDPCVCSTMAERHTFKCRRNFNTVKRPRCLS